MIDKKEKIKSDCEIAYFMGWRINNSFPDKGRVWSKGNRIELDTTMKFFYDWNELNEVVNAIEKLGYNFYTHQARVLIERNDFGIQKGMPECNIEVRSSTVDFDKKMATYMAVSKFTAWYNPIEIKSSDWYNSLKNDKR